jgi:hypothetical protein
MEVLDDIMIRESSIHFSMGKIAESFYLELSSLTLDNADDNPR